MRIAIQPCGDSVAQEHYVDTIENLVPRDRILPFVPDTERSQFLAACGEKVAVWGVTPGKRGQNKTKWSKLKPGDVALLYRKKRIFSQGRITFLLHSQDLAKDLWHETSEGETWEYVYFLDELRRVDVSVDQYNAALGYAPNNIVQGFQVHDGDQADALSTVLDVDPVADALDVVSISLSPDQARERLLALGASDSPAAGKFRNEASIFRSMLFGGALTAACDLCGRVLPCGFLVAAHMKPRSSCSEAERFDPSIVMRACRLGCDELYERSYVVISAKGNIEGGEALKTSTQALRDFATPLIGRTCTAHTPESAPYFNWHRTHQTRRLK